jgi:hypothetical protein
MSHWWTGIPAAEVTVLCGGNTHIVRWEAGELIAVDHGDPEREVTLAALAGETFPCLELLRTWSRRRDDPHVLTLASRGPTDPLLIDFDGLRFHHRGPRRQTEEQTLRLLAADGRLPDRLQATTAAIWTRRLRTGHAALETARPQLEAALYGRVLRTLRAWLGQPQLTIELTMIGPGEKRRIVRTADGVDVSLPFSWLPDVWMRGLAVTFGRLCVAAETTDGSSWTLDTLGPDLADVRTTHPSARCATPCTGDAPATAPRPTTATGSLNDSSPSARFAASKAAASTNTSPPRSPPTSTATRSRPFSPPHPDQTR